MCRVSYQKITPANLSALVIRAELVIDKMLTANCSSCNSNEDFSSFSSDDTTANGDQPKNKKSARYVCLNDTTCVLQNGIYYSHYFIPSVKGSQLEWFSSQAAKPKQFSSRVCCLINAINNFSGDGNGVIKNFDIQTKQQSAAAENQEIGPLGLKIIKQSDIEEPGPVLIFVIL